MHWPCSTKIIPKHSWQQNSQNQRTINIYATARDQAEWLAGLELLLNKEEVVKL